MLARRATASALSVLAGLTLGACGGADGPSGPAGRSIAERLSVSQTFFDKAAIYADMGAYNASYTLEFAALSILVGANTTNFTVASNGAVSTSVAGGAPVTATTAGSYQGLMMRTRIIRGASDEVADDLIGWRGGDNPTDLLFAEDFGDGGDAGGLFLAPDAEWTATTLAVDFSNLSVPNNCNIPSQLLSQIEQGATFTCKVGTVTASFNIAGSAPSLFEANTAAGSRTASASLTGFPAVSVIFDYNTAR